MSNYILHCIYNGDEFGEYYKNTTETAAVKEADYYWEHTNAARTEACWLDEVTPEFWEAYEGDGFSDENTIRTVKVYK